VLRQRLVVLLSVLGPVSWASASSQDLSLGVGERRRLSVPQSVGVVVSEPNVADVHVVSRGVVEIEARASGEAEVDVWTASAQRVQYRLKVRGVSRGSERTDAPYDNPWLVARFGGKRLHEAACVLPFQKRQSRRLFEEAQVLLEQDEAEAAVRKLEQVTRLEPSAATPHLFLGAAWAKLNESERGSQALETFVLSCEEDPRTPAAAEILRHFWAKKTADRM
jgi:hypothetical protein